MMSYFVWLPVPQKIERASQIDTREPNRTRYEVGSFKADHGQKSEPGTDTEG